ncbi:hypothetical protein RA27_05440 [Ruegeria sp. ANG-R]|nr:hypothetical protein RA27_05440 [Ruegeria sp. ANG-R]
MPIPRVLLFPCDLRGSEPYLLNGTYPQTMGRTQSLTNLSGKSGGNSSLFMTISAQESGESSHN